MYRFAAAGPINDALEKLFLLYFVFVLLPDVAALFHTVIMLIRDSGTDNVWQLVLHSLVPPGSTCLQQARSERRSDERGARSRASIALYTVHVNKKSRAGIPAWLVLIMMCDDRLVFITGIFAGLRGSSLRFPPIEATKPEVPRPRQTIQLSNQ